MNKIFHLILFFSLITFGQQKNQVTLQYPNYVGDIQFDLQIDNKDFELCNSKHIYQYFNDGNALQYEGEKLAIEKEFTAKYKSAIIKQQTGLIRINFVVNCKGETDRFRLISMDENYQDKVFLQSITAQLINITKNLKGWKPKKIKEKDIDYYQYLIFKIENGQLKEILP